MSIKSNLEEISSNLSQGVQLVAVTKKRSIHEINELYSCGHKVFGENKVQELVSKKDFLPPDVKWHLIGHLQTNKVKFVVPFVSLIHSVDSIKLLREINKEASKINKVVSILLQVYIADEETKFGWDETELLDFFTKEDFNNFKNVRICGLMGMATNSTDSQKVANEFKHLKSIFDRIKLMYPNPEFSITSMGMSNDYKLAIECGSNMVRVGSALFE